jgi:hypothetical protein
MKPRPFDIYKDYETVAEMWLGHGFSPVSPELLPPTGFIVDGLAAGFVYMCDAPLAWLAWLCVNKHSDKIAKEKWQALDAVIEALANVAKDRGCKLLFAETNNFVLGGRYTQHDFQAGDRGSSQYFRRL